MTNGARPKRTMIEVYLSLGSNLGDREANLREAITRIRALGLEVIRASSLYETEPVGFKDQPWFLNQVIQTTIGDVLASESGPILGDPETAATIQAEALLTELLEIEREMGRRERMIVDGPRVIDIDLLLFGGHVIAHSKDGDEGCFRGGIDVFVPHPRMHQRRFVLEPLCEIAPEMVHPVLNKTCREMLASLDDGSWVRPAGL